VKQYEAVIEVMKKNGGFATLSYLYENVLTIKECEWKTKTPFASIRRIVQDKRFFFKIKPGLWALNSYKEKIKEIFPDLLPDTDENKIKKSEFNHYYYQGLLVELGNIQNFETYIPSQDRNKSFLSKTLSDIVKLNRIYDFSYPEIVNIAKTIDVIWFNNKKLPLPKKVFEVEHTTNIEHSLLKFIELEDFYIDFYIVSYLERKMEYNKIVNKDIFKNLKNRVKFLDYNSVSEWHDKEYELYILKNRINI